ncbi:MAG: LacI family DNA-binding transcriptional regulator, partial [Acetobacteraceae bacterium]
MAARAAVAPATVSNVLSGRRAVGAALRERVLAAIAETGYRPNQLASSLRRRRSDTIGILVPDLANPFFAALVHRLEDLAAEDGYQ